MKGNSICRAGLSIDRNEMLAIRVPMLGEMQALAAANSSVRIWDPFPVLCPGTRCQGLDGSAPTFFDRHHLSAHGDRVLRSDFNSHFDHWFAKEKGSLLVDTMFARPAISK